MEKLNIAKILKDCPKGTKLYSPIFGEVELDEVNSSIFVRHVSNKALLAFYEDGKWHSNGECMLFPSKENRDWDTFQRPFKPKFKVGDTITTEESVMHITHIDEEFYYEYDNNTWIKRLAINKQNNWKLVKFDISTLKTFDNCRYSLDNGKTWKCAQYWYILENYDVNSIQVNIWEN